MKPKFVGPTKHKEREEGGGVRTICLCLIVLNKIDCVLV
jgi:hypothetical protein